MSKKKEVQNLKKEEKNSKQIQKEDLDDFIFKDEPAKTHSDR